MPIRLGRIQFDNPTPLEIAAFLFLLLFLAKLYFG